jgi:hypothetical protein
MEKETLKNMERDLGLSLEMMIPDFKVMIDSAAKSNVDSISIHQDAFAADYQADEFVLLGKAIKYAGIHGVSLTFHGKNRETLK